MKSNMRMRSAYTLTELMVSMIVIGILVGLLLPAVQAAREAARRCNCTSNLAQLGVGMLHYETIFDALPPGVTNPTGPIRSEPKGQHISWIVHVLPQIELASLQSQFHTAAGAYSSKNLTVRRQRIKVLLCPSSEGPQQPVESQECFPWSNYAGCYHDREAPIDVNNNGVLFLNSRITFDEIPDGLSRTLMLGEHQPYDDDLGWVSGTRSTLRNPAIVQTFGRGPATVFVTSPTFVGPFGSSHTGGQQHCRVDSSVMFISSSIDALVYRQLANREDGTLAPEIDW